MTQINWQRILIVLGILGALIIFGVLILYFINKQLVVKVTEKQLLVEDFKKIKVPEKGEKIYEKVAVPIDVLPSAPEATSNLRIFELKGENGKLTPTEFRAYQNDILNIKLNALDQDYDFFLEGYNISTKVKKGEMKIIEFQALNPGIFKFYCSLCLTKNKSAGQIIVIPH